MTVTTPTSSLFNALTPPQSTARQPQRATSATDVEAEIGDAIVVVDGFVEERAASDVAGGRGVVEGGAGGGASVGGLGVGSGRGAEAQGVPGGGKRGGGVVGGDGAAVGGHGSELIGWRG